LGCATGEESGKAQKRYEFTHRGIHYGSIIRLTSNSTISNETEYILLAVCESLLYKVPLRAVAHPAAGKSNPVRLPHGGMLADGARRIIFLKDLSSA
jgi:hypothetical protein